MHGPINVKNETTQLYLFINRCHYSIVTHVHSRKIHFSAQLQVLYESKAY